MDATVSPTPPATVRSYHQYPGAAYLLPADDAENHRLEAQHRLLKDLFNGRLLADRIKVEPGWKILDSGTGTGVWTLDLASVAPPGVSFLGIDISTRLFPHSPPANVLFLQQSILRLPGAWNDTFNVIHQRLLALALRTPEWRTACSSILKALKPGGYVQFTECGRMQTCGAGSASERAWNALGEMFRKRDIPHDQYFDDIPEMLTEAGFVDVEVEEKQAPMGSYGGETGSMWLWDMLEVMRGMKRVLMDTEGISWSGTEEDFEELLKEAENEWNETPGMIRPFYWYTARKPLA